MNSNSTYPGDPSGGMFSADKIGGFGYGIGVSIGILILITTITLTSYFCTRSDAQTTRDRLASPTTTIIEEDDLELGIDEATLKTCPELLYADAKKLMMKESKEGMKKGLRGAMISSATSACCSVCLGDYKDYDAVRILPDCGHMFHVACVDTWLRLRPTCPVCRTSPLPSPLSTPLAEVVPLARHPL